MDGRVCCRADKTPEVTFDGWFSGFSKTSSLSQYKTWDLGRTHLLPRPVPKVTRSQRSRGATLAGALRASPGVSRSFLFPVKAFLTLPSCSTRAGGGDQLWFEPFLKCLLRCRCSSHASPADSSTPSRSGGRGSRTHPRAGTPRKCGVTAGRARAAREGRFAKCYFSDDHVPVDTEDAAQRNDLSVVHPFLRTLPSAFFGV